MFVWASVGAGVLASEVPAPVIVVPEADFDFGTVDRGDNVEHRYVVRNAGTEDLVIHRISASCGCTSATTPPIRVAPGAEEAVEVVLATAGKMGRETQSIVLYSNDPVHPEVRLILTGMVNTGITLEPEEVDFGKVPRGQEVQKTLKVLSRTADLKMTDYRATAPYIRVGPAGSSGGSLLVTLGSDAPMGQIRQWIIIVTNEDQDPLYRIPVRGTVEGEVEVLPERLELGALSPEIRQEWHVLVRRLHPEPVHITGALLEEGFLNAEVLEVEPGMLYRVIVSRGLHPLPLGFFSDTLVIQTDRSDIGSLRVPVVGRVEAPEAVLSEHCDDDACSDS
ncbi:MAG: DUF1573 domain-containing protein [Candidatus Omnitrophica bacterium]|nr:DUF1573 domain-containing protein [Candidatus Omnitrophota bacterium]